MFFSYVVRLIYGYVGMSTRIYIFDISTKFTTLNQKFIVIEQDNSCEMIHRIQTPLYLYIYVSGCWRLHMIELRLESILSWGRNNGHFKSQGLSTDYLDYFLDLLEKRRESFLGEFYRVQNSEKPRTMSSYKASFLDHEDSIQIVHHRCLFILYTESTFSLDAWMPDRPSDPGVIMRTTSA